MITTFLLYRNVLTNSKTLFLTVLQKCGANAQGQFSLMTLIFRFSSPALKNFLPRFVLMHYKAIKNRFKRAPDYKKKQFAVQIIVKTIFANWNSLVLVSAISRHLNFLTITFKRTMIASFSFHNL